MYQEIKSRRLALLVAIALTGGSLAGATNAYAAEVTGQNVTINASNPPSNNATGPYNDPGSAAGVINDPANGDDVSGNTLTLENRDYSVHGNPNPNTIYGGFTRGTGRAKDNIVHIRENGTVDSAVGGITCGGGDAVGNRVYLHAGGLVDGFVSGGSVYGASGSAENNHVVIESGRVNDVIYGGCIGIASTGHATGNTVTITGGEIRGHVYGGFTYGDGDVTGNIVNIGDGAHDLAAGTRIQKSIYGGSNDGGSGAISGNTLNVKASASAQNIHNFDTIKFHFTNTLSPKLTLSDTAGTTIKSLLDITVKGLPTAVTGTLIENVNGITVSDGRSSVSTTGDTAETILSRDTTGKKIDYTRYVFKGARTAESSSFHETWGGRSVAGNTTTGNEITVTSGTHNVVYGGWTSGSGSTAAAENRGDSTYNKVTVDGTETVSEDVYGGMTTVADGKASHNEVTINKGVTLNGHGYVYGGSTDDGSSADNNKVYLNGIRIPGTVYGGTAANGTANGNEVHLNGATVTGPVYGGNGVSTSGNKVYLLNGATVTGGVYGGNATSANDNEVHLNGATVTGPVYGGAANGTGNLLSVKGVNSARWIAGFQKVSFDTAGVAAGHRMLTITDTTNRTALDWNAPTATGTARGIDLIYHEQGIDLSHYTAGSVKSALSADGKSEYDIEAVDEGGTVKRLAYNSYRFKDARTAETVGGETWGGRSRVGNTTTGNEITVSSGTHTEVYGGWTRGASSQTATADKGNSTYNKVTVDGTATVSGNVYGGMTTVAGGKASNNVVTINEGVTLNDSRYVYGGSATSGSSADNNKVYLNGIRTSGTVYGGSTGFGTANGNEVHLNGATVRGAVFGGEGASASKNKVYLLNDAQVTGDVYGGNAASANDNEVHLNGATVTGAVIGGAIDGTGNLLSVKGVNSAKWIAGFQKVSFDTAGVAAGETMLNLNGSAGTTLDRGAIDAKGSTVNGGITLLHNANGITVNGLAATDSILKSETDATTEKNISVHKTGSNITDIRYEGYQFAGVTTPVIDGGEAFGGISRAGNATHTNHITVNGDYANVYGGHTSGTSTTAVEKKNSHDNTVTITGGTISNVYGGYTAAADGTTNNNTVTLAGGTVTGTVSGGNRTADGNTLNVVGMNNRAGSVENFQNMNFDATGAVKDSTLLTVTGTNATKVDWTKLTATGTSVKPLTLLKNESGIDLTSYTGAAKSETTDTTETNVDVRKNSLGRITAITYEGYQFAGVTTPVVSGTDVYGGISRAGNSTHDNAIAVSGDYTNVYGGHTSGAGTTKDDKNNSYNNAVTITGGTLGNVYGGYTAAADGTTNNNTVTLAGGTVTGTVSGGNRTAQGNKLVVNANARVGRIENFEKYVFNYQESMAANPMLTLTGGAAAMNLSAIEANGTVTETPTTLVHNAAGLTIADYDNKPKSILNADGTRETNLDVRKTGTLLTDIIRYSSYSLKGTKESTTNNGNTWGGRSSAGNTTAENSVTITGGNHTNIYGGWTTGTGSTAAADALGDSISNKVAVNGSAAVSGTVYGGFTDVANGKATRNEVTVDKAIAGSVVGGKALGEASGNIVTVKANTGAVTGGEGAITNNNTVNLEGASVNGTITGGTQADGTGNTLNVKGQNAAQNIVGFQKVAFKDAASKLKLKDTGTFNLDTLATNFEATANPVTLVESRNALTLAGGKAFKSELNADGTQETDLDVRGGKKIVRYAYTFAGAKAATTVGSDTWGGRSAAGNTTTGNEITLAGGSYTNVYGGRTTGAGSTAAADKLGDSISNKVTVNGTAAVSGIVYGGYTDVTGGRATGNEVTIEKASVGSVVGGYGTTASGNVINLTDATVSGSVTGGRGTITNDNIIRLRNTKVTGTVTGGSGTITNENRTGFRSVTVSSTAASGTGNTLAVYYGTGTTSIGDLGGIQNIHFDLEDAPTDGTAHTLLSLTNAAGEKNLSDINLAVHRSGATKKLRKGDTFTLVENTTAGGSVSIGDNVTAEGTDGVTRNYTFGIARNADGKLVATVTKAGMNEQAKSLVETRAGASAFLNDGADFLAGAGMSAAQKEAAAAAMTSGGVYGLWAGMGGGSLRHETGSYVDMKGWNLGVGWARENAVKAGTLTFGPFIEYGRGSYDSYLDDGTHGSGKTSYVGVGMMAKLETKANSWIDGALRVGRTKSDYTGLDTSYDTTSTYYAMHVGVGKDFHVREGDTVSAYVRYSYAHTAGASAHLSSGETYDFDAVNSHRLRIGTRYTHGGTELSQIYAGLAWEYEFDGDARATYQGDSTPSPSLKGGSALLELGYRFAPKADSRVSYDLNLSGWQGKRQGVTGGISVKWAF